MQKVCVLFAKKYAGLKSTPLPVVAVVTYMSYNVKNVDVFFCDEWTRWRQTFILQLSHVQGRRGHKKTQVITLHAQPQIVCLMISQ